MTGTTPTTVYVVMGQYWTYNDVNFDGEFKPVVAFRDRAAAERECRRLILDEAANRPHAHDDWEFEVVELPLLASPAGDGG